MGCRTWWSRAGTDGWPGSRTQVTGDGRTSLVFWNNGGKTLYWSPLPEDPRRSPWPDIRVIASGREENGLAEEGLAITDIDGDGRNEIVAGTHWYKYTGRTGHE